MLRTSVLFFTLAGFAVAQTSGSLYGHLYSGVYPNQSVIVGKIDTSSGAITPIATLGSMPYATSSVAAFDTSTHRYFAYVSDTSGSRLSGVNVQTGEVTSSAPAFSYWPSTMEFDSTAGFLYGTLYVGSSPTGWESLVRIDLNTQAQVPVATIATGAFWLSSGVSAFDSTTHSYYAVATVGSETSIYTVNVQTGRVTASAPLISIPSSLQFDPVRRRLLGVVNLSGTEYVASLDPSSGTATPLAVAAPGSVYASPVSAYESVPSRYFFYASTGFEAQLFDVSLATGSVKFGAMMTPPLALEFDPQP